MTALAGAAANLLAAVATGTLAAVMWSQGFLSVILGSRALSSVVIGVEGEADEPFDRSLSHYVTAARRNPSMRSRARGPRPASQRKASAGTGAAEAVMPPLVTRRLPAASCRR